MRALIFVILFSILSPSAFASEQVFFYHTDPVGTPLAMTNSNGAVVWQADYKPFGEENSVTGAAANDRRFVGKEKDEETGFSYFEARYEDARTGRFIAVDPVRAVDSKTSKTNEKLLLNPQRLNAYAYGLNNPYRFVDPDGHNPILIGLGIVWLGEMVMPQTMGSSLRDSFIDRHWGDLLMLPLGIERVGVKAVSNSTQRIIDMVKPGGQWIGKVGSSTTTRELGGGIQKAEEFFKNLSQEGRAIENSTYPGQIVELPGGGRAAFRPSSKSGPPTIDLHDVPGLPQQVKFKFKD